MSSAAPHRHTVSLSQVWCAESLAQSEGLTQSSGFSALDAELPGGGWPVGAMTEILHGGPETFAWPLLLPALSAAVAAHGTPVALIGAPYQPFSPALAAQGVPPEALLWVRCDAPQARLWACEQALRCADVAAVLAWLPQARVGDLRRLQLAAAQFDRLLWVFRPASVAGQASPARLRLQVEPGPADDMGDDTPHACAEGSGPTSTLAVHLLKRRGPPLAMPVMLASQPARLAAVLAASRRRREQRLAVSAPPLPASLAPVTAVVRLVTPLFLAEPAYALDRTPVAA